MSVVIAIIGFIVVLFVLIISHETGHFIAAKKAGVVVEEFGLGIPPRLFAIKRGETSYSLNLIPLGAFVKTVGEDDPTVPGGLAGKGPWTRMGVYFAGPLVNVLLAFILLSVFFMLPTEVIKGNGAMVHSVSAGSPAEEAGIKPGDIILKIGDQEIHEWEDVQKAINSDGGAKKTFLLDRDRDGEEFTIPVTPEFNSTSNRYTIGIVLCWGIVTGVEKDSPAETADIRVGDTILGVDGKTVYSNESMLEALNSTAAGEEIEVVLLQNDEIVSTSLPAGFQDPQTIGFSTRWVDNTHIEKPRLPFWQAFYRGGDYIVHYPSLIKEAIPLIREDPSKAVQGPIGAGQLTVEAVESFGFSSVLLLGGVISISLALFNFIPIPPLDGGRMLVALIEGVRRGKRLPPRAVRLAYAIGTALMIILFVVIMYSDILRLVRGESFNL